jgi:hypothetical protein
MLRAVLVDPESGETKNQICWHNIITADTNLCLQYFMLASQAWFKLNPTQNYQDLEKILRKNNLNTHLCAAMPQIVPNSKLIGKVDSVECKYECVYSCRPKEYAINEVLQHWPTYEKNFENLKYAGSLACENINDDTFPGTIKFDNDEMQFNDHIVNNTKKLIYEEITPSEFLNDVVDECKEKYGEEPKEIFIGYSTIGTPVYGLVINNNLVCAMGYTVYNDETGEEQVELVNLQC